MHIYIYICMHTDSDLSTTEDLSKDVGFLYWFFFSAIFSHEFLFSYRLVDHALAFFFFLVGAGPIHQNRPLSITVPNLSMGVVHSKVRHSIHLFLPFFPPSKISQCYVLKVSIWLKYSEYKNIYIH